MAAMLRSPFAPSRLARLLTLACVAGGSVVAHAQQAPAGDRDAGYNDGGYANPADGYAADPPYRVARISVLNGDASVAPVSAAPDSADGSTASPWSPAELNLPLTTGDRLYTGPGSLAELEAGQLTARLGGTTDLSVIAMTDTLAQWGLAAGSLHLRAWAQREPLRVTLSPWPTPHTTLCLRPPVGVCRVSIYCGTAL